jgi:DNA mismatch repair protein MSH6
MKVGVVDQTETPEMLAEANKAKGAVKRKAVKRELTSVLTPGTIVDAAVVGSHNAVYTLALTEKTLSAEEIAAVQAKFQEAEAQFLHAEQNGLPVDKTVLQKLSQEQQAVVEIGFAFADCATGRFVVGQTKDDQQRSFLRTLLGFINPRELVLPRGSLLSAETQHVLQHDCQADTIHNHLAAEKEFWTAERTVKEINQAHYFEGKKAAAGAAPMEDWPIALAEAVQDKEDLLLSAFGGLTFYLRSTMHDRELLSQKHVQNYFNARGGAAGGGEKQHLVLDGQTLANLEVVKSQKGTVKGTLLEFVDRTSSPFGKRRLREWLLQPLVNIQSLTDRQDAVEFFMTHPELSKHLSKKLKELPDLERNLSRIHANGLVKKVEAIMYENVSSKQLQLFTTTLTGFASAADLIRQFTAQVESDPDFRTGSRLSRLISSQEDGGLLPLFEDPLNEVRASFDAELALKKGRIQPNPGINREYDELVEQLDTSRKALAKYMKSIQIELADSSIKWMHQAKVSR